MRSTWPICALLLVLSAAVFLSGERRATGEPGQKAKPGWTYKVMDVVEVQKYDAGSAGIEAGLKKLGAEGWELVSVEPGIPSPRSVTEAERDGGKTKTMAYMRYAVYYLKRPAQ